MRDGVRTARDMAPHSSVASPGRHATRAFGRIWRPLNDEILELYPRGDGELIGDGKLILRKGVGDPEPLAGRQQRDRGEPVEEIILGRADARAEDQRVAARLQIILRRAVERLEPVLDGDELPREPVIIGLELE